MRNKKQPKRIEERATSYLEPGETPRAAVKGQKAAPWWAWLAVAIPGMLSSLSGEREVIVTDRYIYVLAVSGERAVLIEKRRVGSIEVRFAGGTLFLGRTRISVAFGSRKDAAKLAAAASS